MFKLQYEHLSLEPDLQIVHADVTLEIDGETIIEEPLCIDVGLPALLLSAVEDVEPSRWSEPAEWHKMPFVCCGCGDPECRAFSFIVRHSGEDEMELLEIEEKPSGSPRVLGSYTVRESEYKAQVTAIGEAFLRFVDGLDYRPYYSETVRTVRELMDRLQN